MHLTNAFGAEPVHIGAATVALRARGAGNETRTVPGTRRRLTFGGRRTAVLPAGGTLAGDPVGLVVPAGADLVISIHLPERTRIETASPRSFQTTLVTWGDTTAAADPAPRLRTGRWFLLAGVSVRSTRDATAIAALGDSITCGVGSRANANHRWPDLFAARLRAAGRDLGVLNAGISGNRLLSGYDVPTGLPASRRAGRSAHVGQSALRRFDRDVLALPGVRHLVTLIGVNDLGRAKGTTAEDLIAGHRELAARGRRAGLRVIGGTMLPFGGAAEHFDTPANQVERARFNAWLRTAGEFDAVVDFDAAIRDPADPRRMLPAYDCGDHLHPGDAGMAALATAISTDLFT
ncbi:SGNH/GDSL hydrolase family protein [Actinoplanes sp. NPDC051861]|uniref:SGNH/GDSL hydrolase family protein n=1 Tax=Actinoplanes sp. NPDC051861 TaxID=3155170 RepID=UPI003439FAE2